jgi:pentatricopeptide repeat protein
MNTNYNIFRVVLKEYYLEMSYDISDDGDGEPMIKHLGEEMEVEEALYRLERMSDEDIEKLFVELSKIEFMKDYEQHIRDL